MAGRTATIYYGGFRWKSGGAFSHAQALETGLRRQGWDVSVVTLDSLPAAVRFLPHIVECLVNLVDLPLGFYWKGRVTRWLYRWLLGRPANLRVFEDVYIAWDSDVPSVTMLHAVWSDNLQAFRVRPTRLAALKAREARLSETLRQPIATVSEPYAEHIRHDHFGRSLCKPIAVVELGLDCSGAIASGRGNLKSIIYTGTLEARKNLAFLMQVFERVHAEDPEFRLTLVGEGPDRKALEDFAERRSLPVRFLGRLPHHEVLVELPRHGTYVHTSTKESFSFSLLEAKLAGLTTCGHASLQVPREFIDIVVPDFRAETWAKVLLELGAKGAPCRPRFPAERYTIDRMTGATLALSLPSA